MTRRCVWPFDCRCAVLMSRVIIPREIAISRKSCRDDIVTYIVLCPSPTPKNKKSRRERRDAAGWRDDQNLTDNRFLNNTTRHDNI